MPNSQATLVSSTDLWVPLKALSPLMKPVKLSLLAGDRVTNRHGVFFLVLAKKSEQKPNLFRRAMHSPTPLEDPGDQEQLTDFSLYTLKVHHMIRRLGYEFKSKFGLNFGKRRCRVPAPKVPKGKPVDYYHRIKRGLRYVKLVPSESELECVESFHYDHSFDTSL